MRIPKSIHKVLDLSDYAVQTRYPGEYYPVKLKEYKAAVRVAEQVLNWVTNLIDSIKKYYGRINGHA